MVTRQHSICSSLTKANNHLVSTPKDVTGVESQTHTLTTASISLLLHWIRECSNKHEPCRELGGAIRQRDLPRPSRLVEVGNSHEPLVRLCYTKNIPVTQGSLKYTTLSHCWGNFPITRLLQDNHDSFLQSIDYNSLSKTFQDAIRVTRSIGIRYIWIDSLCIIQNSEEDWAIESQRMEGIYSSSYLNIAAGHAADGRSGLDIERDCRSLTPLVVNLSSDFPIKNQHDRYVCVEFGLWGREVLKCPLASRAWVAQERFLSPRTIHFASSQIFYECPGLCACESYPRGLPTAVAAIDPRMKLYSRSDLDLMKNPAFEFVSRMWIGFVEDYSRMALTKQADKLIAIAGIARRIASWIATDDSDTEYSAGVWTLIRGRMDMTQLLWIQLRQTPKLSSRLWRAPSWSWASVDGAVTHNHSDFTDSGAKGRCASIHHRVKMNLIDHTPFGRVRGGILQLQGSLIPVRLRLDRHHCDPYSIIARGREMIDKYDLTAKIWRFSISVSHRQDGPCVLVPVFLYYQYRGSNELLYAMMGLILSRVDQSPKGMAEVTTNGLYRRIGTFYTIIGWYLTIKEARRRKKLLI